MKKVFLFILVLFACGAIQAQTLTLKFPKMVLTKPISLSNKSNLTISGDSIVGGTVPCILLQNCNNIHITHCKLINSTTMGIQLATCSNITIDSCYIKNVSTGVYAQACPGNIKVNYNWIIDVVGPFPRGQAVQFNNVTGGGNRITYNRVDNESGKSNPEDVINVYKSQGLATDPITVSYNWVRGGGPSTTGAGITVGDQGGSNISVLSNIVVNSGADGIQVAGGTNIMVASNIIYSDVFPWSHVGLAYGNYSGLAVGNITMKNNTIKWVSGSPVDQWKGSKSMEKDTSHSAKLAEPIGWRTNIVNSPTVKATAIPATMAVIK